MWDKPIVEIRTDEYARGALASYLEAYKTLARPVLSQHVGEPLASYNSIVGKINCVVQIWGYDSMEAYAASRAATESDARWREYLRASQGILRFTHTRLTRRVIFPGVDEQAGPSREKPVIDFRTYLITHGQMDTFLRTTQEFAMKVMLRHIGAPLGYYQTISGNPNQVTHLWGYDSLGDMESRREARNADPQWPDYIHASNGIYESQDTQILRRLSVMDA